MVREHRPPPSAVGANEDADLIALLDLPPWVWHPLGPCHGAQCGYNLWSGIGSDVGEVSTLGILVTLMAMAAGMYRKHNCHVHRCWRLAWHPHPVNGHPICKHHHPDDPRRLDAARSLP